MTRQALHAALLAIIFLGGMSALLWRLNGSLRADLEAASREIEGYRISIEVHDAHIKRMEAENARWAETLRDLQSMEGRDAPLSDHLSRAAGRLWK